MRGINPNKMQTDLITAETTRRRRNRPGCDGDADRAYAASDRRGYYWLTSRKRVDRRCR
jgi:hypothetical protein